MIDELYWASAEVLVLAVQFPTSPALPPPAELRQRIMTALDAMVGRCRSSGIPEPDIAETRYALVAFLDEQLLKSNWAGRTEWMSQPLQLALYGEFNAGENFFVRLRALLQQGNRALALQGYYLCLALGFRGAYGMSGDPNALQSFMDAARQQLAQALPPTTKFGPHAEPRDRARAVRLSNAPLIALVLGSVLLAVAAVVGLERLVAADVKDVVHSLPAPGAELSPP